MSTPTTVIILAAGQGTRMRSALPKVLHPLAGQPLLAHVIQTAQVLTPERIVVVYGHGGDQVRLALADAPVTWVEQTEQLGTGHAVAQALPEAGQDDRVLVLYGDVPLVAQESLARLLRALDDHELAVQTMMLEDPTGYGRILRDAKGQPARIVEQKDATADELTIREVNTGFMAAYRRRLEDWLGRVDRNNAQGEYYLTDCISLAAGDGVRVAAVVADDPEHFQGVNDRVQLAALERAYQRRQAEILMRGGVSVRDPARLDIRGTLSTGQDVTLDVNVILEGDVTLGEGVQVGAHCVLRNVSVGPGTIIQSHCILEDATIGADARIGPFARIRPGTELAAGVHVGNFVEIKKSRVGEGSKVNHLSYVGDSQVGRGVNVGAGTITCNYDGANKHLTVIGDGAFIGSNTALVAPVTVGEGATIGAGSTINADAPAGQLTLTRAPLETRTDWQRPTKKGG
ncbi:bifunctional UDP-N-acetylglucosamine diphosphorylase/glucosamine-1-phosphate N-acetyltransferase GlmU [Ectothiorhodospira variabilis]|uniref:bifunctional UDP-N-acetylglucosamine diphosphorylase/glucosamine-1-phosphate N-acetyltransferase GlmU n=1 Tax=Ectothiorhodospira variabilis TaxID=505694 RepID=UPI001EFC2B3A|nr:bifunctional UDP-N-acetylglucosamine diphosphorylase/glucosamine-1-phosphate N-acetyltransferase GlmU [Ectothiorhodospira variabilis]MCG5503542.1 bifunctional UDP-N-acetylglucosamine diphosphorylase/glucosamine-1-phosphate N-acetyltransferase GlmU [Ectothiorhodospira variabilis]MCG5506743.1 bifunctional UDP-N-acetylglucosamine diphosphorylase/glucosamine-1-phosphate N-acetyltransferase GlmU [Ectothiorhodospira variabilis]